jgi:leukotriene-A4 hydrolase
MTLPVLIFALAAAPAAVDVHSQGNPAEALSTHISLDLTLRFEAKVIAGRADLTLAYPAGPAAHLDLDTRDLKVTAVTTPGTGKALAFTLEAPVPHLGQRLRITLPRPAPAKVRVEYETSPQATALQWLEPRQTTSGTLPFLFTQSQAINARSWIPCQDSPGVRVTYDAVVRVPPGMTAVMSAAHQAHEKDKGVYRFRMSQAIPSYLIALAAGEITFKALSPRTGVYAEPAVLDKAAWEFVDVEKMVQVTERLYGPYRWGRWDTIVLPPSFPFGGMENPRLTFATPTLIAGDRSLVNVLAHELAHSWSGNLVTNATWSDFWLNEGFTTYIENRIVEALYGKEFAEMQALLGQRELKELVDDPKTPKDDTKLHITLTGRDPDDGMTAVAYEKGANVLRVLEHRFGRARFDAFLRRYFDTHAFHSITTAVFLEDLRRDLFRSDEALWKEVDVEQWVHGPGIPANMIVPASDRFQKTRAAAEAFARTGALDGVRKEWVTAEWLDFLNSLPREMTREQLGELDRHYGFSKSGNAEVLFAWLMHVVRNAYEPAYPALEGFLTRMGRRKFLRPLYQAMQDNPKTQALARTIYAKARPTYHPIAVTTVDAILKP